MRQTTMILAALTAVIAVACAQPVSEEPVSVSGNVVGVEDNSFTPSSLQVDTGETVTWNWTGGHDHNVSGDGFTSETQRDGSFSHTFEEPGEYDYLCTLHGGMKGSVVVVEPDANT